ncbi:MAG: hypothetical protein R3D26_05130 [Cyanobacteriota/Melainabacteria group bacterium]
MNDRDKSLPKKKSPIKDDGSGSFSDATEKKQDEQIIPMMPADHDWTTCLADEWEISESSMLTDEIIAAHMLTVNEMEAIIDQVAHETFEEETEKREQPTGSNHNSSGRKAAENLITSLSESISGTKNPTIKEENGKADSSTEAGSTDSLVPDETADFPSSSNPFKHATNSGLLEIARSSGTTESTLMWLAQNPDASIRSAVAGNQRASKPILAKLIKDHDGHVKLAALDNPELTSDLVVDLLKDSNPLVSLRAYEVLNERRKKAGLEPIKDRRKVNTVNDLPALSKENSKIKKAQEAPITASGAHEAIEFLRMMAQRHSTPIERLAELASHPDTLVRAAVARNSKSPIDVLWGLVNDKTTEVKQNLIKNESCPLELLWALRNDPDQHVSGFARQELEKFDIK